MGAINQKYAKENDGDDLIAVGTPIVRVASFPSNIATLDFAIGVGGIPRGRMGEIYGPESSGKTTLCLQIAAACQKHYFEDKERNGVVAYIDTEHAVDPTWATKLGVDFSNVLYCQPGYGEQALDTAEMIAQSGGVDLIIVDSIASLTPKAELEGELTDHNIAGLARLMGKSIKRIHTAASQTKTASIFINQLRDKPGVMFGNPETTPGGKAMKYAADYRIDIRKGSQMKDGTTVIGFESHATVVKNKLAPPFAKADLQLAIGRPEYPVYGIDTMLALIRVGQVHKIITAKSSSICYGDQRLGQGMVKASRFLYDNPEFAEKLRREIYSVAMTAPAILDSFSLDDEVVGGDDDNGFDMEE